MLPFLILGLMIVFSAGESTQESPLLKYLKPVEITEIQSGIDMIDCIYIINLEERKEKWTRMKKIFDEHGLKPNRFNAVNGWTLPMEARKEIAAPYPVRQTPGQLGCLLSHLSIVKDAYERNYNCIWVCEDDLLILEEVDQVALLLRKLVVIDPEWDIFYTDVDAKDVQGHRVISVSGDFRPDQEYFHLEYYTQKIAVDEEIVQIRQRFGMYSAIISRHGIKKILEHFTSQAIWTNIDIDVHYIPGIKEYSPNRDIVSIWTQSNISDTERQPLSCSTLRSGHYSLACSKAHEFFP